MKTTFELINELIIALSHLLWPILAFMAILIFKKELSQLLGRITRGKILGSEFEFDKKVDEFASSVKAAEQEIPLELLSEEVSGEEINILNNPDPKISIIMLARDIERELRELVASLGLLGGGNYGGVHQSMKILEGRGALPKHAMGSLEIFWELRNKIVHGKEIEYEENTIRVLDIGMTLLDALKSIPHEINIVYNPGVDIYSDEECEQRRLDIKGIILETTSPGGVEKTHHIFPTTKSDYYQVGEQVSWEWDLSKSWGASWYIDPDTNEKKVAWGSAGEFTGRHMKEI